MKKCPECGNGTLYKEKNQRSSVKISGKKKRLQPDPSTPQGSITKSPDNNHQSNSCPTCLFGF